MKRQLLGWLHNIVVVPLVLGTRCNAPCVDLLQLLCQVKTPSYRCKISPNASQQHLNGNRGQNESHQALERGHDL